MTTPTTKKHVHTLVLDAHPLITQTYSDLSNFADEFYVTPTVYNEIKDPNARKNLIIWDTVLKKRHPKPESIKKANEFARLTGDYNVLSKNDIHILALAYELDVELHNGNTDHIRRYPGEKLTTKKAPVRKEEKNDGWETVAPKKKQRRRGGKKQREKREAAAASEYEQKQEIENSKQDETKTENSKEVNASELMKQTSKVNEDLNLELQDNLGQPNETVENANNAVTDILVDSTIESPVLDQDEDDSDDEGEWITADNVKEVLQKDAGEEIFESSNNRVTDAGLQVALSSQDFAVQNVALQMGLKLMNTSTGMQIKKIRNYMMRCHACFKLQPITSADKNFCDFCGGNTLLRCTVVVNSTTGELKPLLKKNFEWHKKGNKYSLPSPLSKNTQKRLGKGGFQHNKNSKNFAAHNNVPILRSDQKEYLKSLKNEQWVEKQNEKFLENWVGGGSADNFYSPFANNESSSRYHSNLKVNPGRYVNAPKKH